MFALPQPLSEAWHPSVERMARDPWYQRVCVQVAVTLLASAFHLLPMEELPAELGELLNPDRLMAGIAQEASPQAPKLQQEQDVPQGVPGREDGRETGTEASSRRYILRAGRMIGILSSFPLNGRKEKANSKGFTMEAAELPDAFR